MSEIKLTQHGNNAAISVKVLPEEEMRRLGFTDRNPKQWCFSRSVGVSKDDDIDFVVTINKDGSDWEIEIIDFDFGQPYDYQYLLSKKPKHECNIVNRVDTKKCKKYFMAA